MECHGAWSKFDDVASQDWYEKVFFAFSYQAFMKFYISVYCCLLPPSLAFLSEQTEQDYIQVARYTNQINLFNKQIYYTWSNY